MVNIEVIQQRLKQLTRSLDKIERYREISLEEFLKDDIIQDVVEYNLFISINMIVDIASHIVVDDNIGNPESLGDAFRILNKENYLSDEESELYTNMVGLRNILSHEYIKIDKKIIYSVLKNNLKDFKRFIIFVNDNFM